MVDRLINVSPTQSLILADIPERNRLRELVAALNARRDDIAALDLEIETLQYQLGEFEGRYRERLYDEHKVLKRIESLVRHFERWAELLRAAMLADEPDAPKASKKKKKKILERAEKIAETRQKELEHHLEETTLEENARREAQLSEDELKEGPDRQARLKAAYRSLARRYHPDLARQEDERVRFGSMMTKINELYRSGDLERLELLATQAKGGEIDEPHVPIEAQIATLQTRLSWFETVHQNLLDERQALEGSKTCQLLRDVEQAEAIGRDLIAELKDELRSRGQAAEVDVRVSIRALENDVSSYNRKSAGGDLVRPVGGALQKRFDPFADKALVRFGLEELEKVHFDGEASRCAEWVLQVAESHPPLLRALLFAYVADLSQFPLPGLERYDDIKLRFELLEDERCKLDETAERWTFERALVEGEQVIEFGPKQATERVVRMGLKIREDAMRHGILLALRRHAIRREFKRVLSVLGERKHCDECTTDVFTVPLYRLRGIDALRALVCPTCATTLASYFMPKGDDVQAVLNVAFIDFELIHEWSFQLGKTSIATQLTQHELEECNVGDLRKRFFNDVLKRNSIDVTLAQVVLEQDGAKLSDRRALEALPSRSLVVRFADGAEVSEGDALELLKHRIRTRFSDA